MGSLGCGCTSRICSRRTSVPDAMSVDEDTCREAFRLVALNVAVIASDDGSGPHGCTATAWAEDPRSPFVATALRRHGGTRSVVGRTGRFGASVLGSDSADLARRFAGRAGRFDGVAYHSGRLGQPLLDEALVTMECVVLQSVDFGTYDLLVGRIDALDVNRTTPPLIFWNGSFRTVASAGGANG